MPAEKPPFFILTGPPGAGKTTLLEAVAPHFSTVPEAARRVLAEERRTGGTATGEQDPAAFVSRMLETMIADYDAAHGPTVFDRGLPDLLAFCAYYALDTKAVQDAIRTRRYQTRVFCLPAWQQIYQQDEERTLSFEGAQAFGTLTREGFHSAGYEWVEVPKADIATRVRFIRDQIGG